MKQKNNSKKKKILENKYNDNNLKIVKHEIIEYNPYISNTERKKTKTKTYSDIINNMANNVNGNNNNSPNKKKNVNLLPVKRNTICVPEINNFGLEQKLNKKKKKEFLKLNK